MTKAIFIGIGLALSSYVYQAFGDQNWRDATMAAFYQLSSCLTVGVFDWWTKDQEF